MAPFEALQGRKSRSPVYWNDIGERKLLEPELTIQAVEKVAQNRKYLQAAQDRQQSWVDSKRRPLEFVVGDHIFLKISPTRGVIRFESKRKLSPRYIGPFEIVERIGAVAYKLALPLSLEGVHDVFHVSQLRRYVPDEKHVLNYSELTLRPNLSYEVQPVTTLIGERRSSRTK